MQHELLTRLRADLVARRAAHKEKGQTLRAAEVEACIRLLDRTLKKPAEAGLVEEWPEISGNA